MRDRNATTGTITTGTIEEEEDEHDDEQCVDQSFYDFVEASLMVSGRVVGHLGVHAGGESSFLGIWPPVVHAARA